ncbi:MAG: permease [Elusimicrobiaceae bacterium]|nr:permease [Elusimicrobiaceae bacterium]
MFDMFTRFADWGITLLGVSKTTAFGAAVHFFLEDFTKIIVLIYVLIFTVSLFRSQLSAEKVKAYLSGKSRWYGYVLAVVLGIVTPFCSCSSIPLFVGFLAACIPFGVTMAFLISSPLVSEIAAVLLVGTPGAGWLAAGIYVLSGCLISVLGGYLCDRLRLVRWIQPDSFLPEKKSSPCRCCGCGKERKSRISRIKELLKYAHSYAWNTLRELFWYILAGLLVGAFIHGYIPQAFFAEWLGRGNWYAVPLASVAGAPLYASHVGVIPVIQSLLGKGVPLGTALVLLMSITALSLPEMIMLNRVLKWKLIGWFCGFLILSFIITGYLLNMLI